MSGRVKTRLGEGTVVKRGANIGMYLVALDKVPEYLAELHDEDGGLCFTIMELEEIKDERKS